MAPRELFDALRHAIAEAPLAELPSIRGALAELEASVFLRMVTPATKEATAPGDPKDKLLTVNEAAAFLNQKPQWVRAHQSELHVVRIGRTVRFSEKQLASFVRRRSYN
jgi:hypothetical protein